MHPAECIRRFDPGLALCAATVLDPRGSLAPGTPLAVFAPDRLDNTLLDFAHAGCTASVIGRAERGCGVSLVARPAPVTPPGNDSIIASAKETDRGSGTVNSNQSTVSYPSRPRAR